MFARNMFSIIFIPEKNVHVNVKFHFINRRWIDAKYDEWSSIHTLEGIFGVYGRTLQTKGFVGEISLLELAPMILSLFGLKMSNKFSNKLMLALFKVSAVSRQSKNTN